MIFYSIYYFIIIILLILDYFFKKNKIFRYIAIASIVFVSGSRYATGYDFFNYYSFYTTYLFDSLEPLFKLSVIVLKYFSSDPQLLIFIYSLFTIIIMYVAITKYTKYIRTSFFIYMIIPGLYLNSFSIIRFSLAQSIVFIALFYLIYKQDKAKFYTLAIVSTLFHYSAIVPSIIVLIFYKILRKTYSFLIYLMIILVSYLLYKLNLAELFLSYASGEYAGYIDTSSPPNLLKSFVLSIFILTLIYFKPNYVKNTGDIISLNMLFLGVITYNIFMNFEYVTRLTYYFLIFQVILIPKLIYSFKRNDLKILFLFLFLFYYIAIFTNALITDAKFEGSANTNILLYKNYFLKDSINANINNHSTK
jgi:transmembrane protein EpsG